MQPGRNGQKASQKKPKKRWAWDDRQVSAHTKGEARALLKRSLGLARLPVGAHVRLVGVA